MSNQILMTHDYIGALIYRNNDIPIPITPKISNFIESKAKTLPKKRNTTAMIPKNKPSKKQKIN